MWSLKKGYHTKTRSFGQLIKEDDNVLRTNTCTDYEYSTTDRGKVESIASNRKKGFESGSETETSSYKIKKKGYK